MLRKITLRVSPGLGREDGPKLQRSLLAMPGVQQVIIAYPHRVEVHYDGTEVRASSFLTLIRARGLTGGLG